MSRGSILKKILIIIGVILAGAAGFIIYVTVTASPIPKITEVEFPEKINLNEEVWGKIGLEDSEGDVVQLIADELDRTSTDILDLTELGATGITEGYLPYGQEVNDAQFMFQRLILVDAQGNRSEHVGRCRHE